ncbi:ParA family protein [Fluviispira vulneris]|uniref:ParA family protein n=1 Tax=Fluviispira vulneris TaxID=2763012 RepID=UPI001644BC82|nr:ParA family protein [Fluviispira vulneris]
MGKILTVTIQKGGSGKTTCAVNLASCLAYSGKKVLLVDLDYQANATELLNVRSRELKSEQSVANAILKKVNFKKFAVKTNVENLDLLPSSTALEEIVLRHTGKPEQLFLLADVLNDVRNSYDFVIIDTNPNPDCLFQSALRESDFYLVPMFAENDVIDGLAMVVGNAEKIKQYYNSNLKMLGCVIQKFDKKSAFQLAGEKLLRKIGNENDIHIFETIIPFSQMIYGASMKHQALIIYKEKSPISKAYLSLAEEAQKQIDLAQKEITGATSKLEIKKENYSLNSIEIEDLEI